MQQREWTNIDKSTWPDGPWMNGPDKEQFTDEATGLPCLINRNQFGALCGYVGVSEGHPWFQVPEDDIDADVHGGLTYADFCQEGSDGHTICHIVDPGENDRAWWVGFDCSHLCDFEPVRHPVLSSVMDFLDDYSGPQVYRDRAYVKDQCARLAAQAVEAAT